MSKPFILTVDDEPEVLNAVERDLRRHFRSDYRIIKAGSGAEALEAATQLKGRNAAVALFVADERMPQMSGTEFLTKAQEVYPDARKVLLTAYADTSAAITGINTIGLDHYLMKPWDPPELNLYPVLDDILSDWQATFLPPFEGIQVAGSRWSPQSHDVKDFLSRQQIPYRWVDLDSDAEMQVAAEAVSPDLRELPVVFFPDGTTLVSPTTRDLAEKLGLQTIAQHPFYDLIVVGGGPTGLAASVYAASEGLRTVLIESDAPGGQAGTSSQIENYLGFPKGIAGADLARRAATQARRFGAEVVTPQEVTSVRVADPYRVVTLSDGTELGCYALLLASGMNVNRLEAPGVDKFTGAGVYYGAAIAEAAACQDEDVFLVGGGNSAGQAAMLFSRYAKNVTLVIRGDSLEKSMSRYLISRIEESPNTHVLPRTDVVGAAGEGRLESLELKDRVTGSQRTVPAGALFVFIGSVPRSDMVADLVQRDEQGFILTGVDLMKNDKRPPGWKLAREPFLLETSIPGIFAAGDVRHASTKRVAAAVGEGSASVGMIHRYLESV